MKYKLRSHSFKLPMRLLRSLGILSAMFFWSISASVSQENQLTITDEEIESKIIVVSQNQDSQSSNSEAKVIKVGVMAILGVEKTRQKWQPTIDYLSQNIPGYIFQLVSLEFDTMKELIAKGEIDFVLPNPGMYVELEWVYGARRIATLQNLRLGKPYTQFGAVIFRHKDHNDIQELQDLKGKKFMAVSKIAFGGWQMACKTLEEAGITRLGRFLNQKRFNGHDLEGFSEIFAT